MTKGVDIPPKVVHLWDESYLLKWVTVYIDNSYTVIQANQCILTSVFGNPSVYIIDPNMEIQTVLKGHVKV